MDIILKDVEYGDTTTVSVKCDRPDRSVFDIKVTKYFRDMAGRLTEAERDALTDVVSASHEQLGST